MYSYYLPLFDIYETNKGFVFEKTNGLGKGLKCSFSETNLTTECVVPSSLSKEALFKLLGLNKINVFADLCLVANMDECVSKIITLINEEEDSRYVFYSIYLSRNTDYYANTLKWAKQAIINGYVDSSSYISREFNKIKKSIDIVFDETSNPIDLACKLLFIKSVGVKSVASLLLHAYGLTRYAPIDRHYANYLGVKGKLMHKNTCIRRKMECSACNLHSCIYRQAVSKYGIYNGVVQSLVYINSRLKQTRRSEIEEILVRDPSLYVDDLEKLLIKVKSYKLYKLG
jgi:hypothetical protein